MADSRRAWARALFAASAGPDAEATRRLLVDVFEGLAATLSDSRMREGLEDPAIPKGRRVELLEAAIPAGAPRQARELFGRFARLLVDKGRIALLPAIGTSFGELVDAAEGVERLDIEAAREPSEAEVGKLARAWARAGGRVVSRVRVDASLIGGYRLRSGSVRYDFSIAGRVERLRRYLARPIAAAKE